MLNIVLCSNFTKERRIYEHVWTYFVYNYMLVSPEHALTSLFLFLVLVFCNLKMR